MWVNNGLVDRHYHYTELGSLGDIPSFAEDLARYYFYELTSDEHIPMVESDLKYFVDEGGDGSRCQ